MFSSVMERLNERRHATVDSGMDSGFTLIELMVVLLILAILPAIAIPTFLGVTGGANDRAAQSNLNTALTTAKSAAAANNQTYTGLGITGAAPSLAANEPSIQWTTGATAAVQGPVSTYISTDGAGVILASNSKNNGGTCFFASDNQGTGTVAGQAPYTGATAPPLTAGTMYAEAKGHATCNAGATIPALDNSWVAST